MEEETACLKHALRVSCEGCEVQVRLIVCAVKVTDRAEFLPSLSVRLKALILSPGEAAADCLFATAVLELES